MSNERRKDITGELLSDVRGVENAPRGGATDPQARRGLHVDGGKDQIVVEKESISKNQVYFLFRQFYSSNMFIVECFGTGFIFNEL